MNDGLICLDVRHLDFDPANQMLYAGTNGGGVFRYSLGTPVDEPVVTAVPSAFALHANYPNPFNPETTITYDLPTACHVSLSVYNLKGQEMARLVDSQHGSGTHMRIWDGRNGTGQEAPSGIYIYRMTAGNYRQSRKMLLNR
jgi:hypothetical protein